ncbi:LOW QUALITY PROTEIN: BRCA1-associated RING domain protein 1 [Gymnodraco acuticeps]|uniref:LOW QUALITY PROTEIN: BRCA1-associated RING domain protein 1 n=1 Tax=Gymnodraco acuticeps TaxID=8218 RepID=A0A6P8T802_GYMAC|nr:LOW QUALITY PROTEIN: BRCA1-associated RING domain protein 1 [Gymnodraco acuticeps]
MDNVVPTQDWKNTKEAVANFRQLLLCSKCSNVMTEPVCLGMCEHMLCRSCAGPGAGDGCVVCQSPAWVKDIQTNKELSRIIHLFSGLESLLNPTEQPAETSLAEIQTPPHSPVLKHKKNIKIWFSPRSRKVRCSMEKPSEVTVAESTSSGETVAAQPDALTAPPQDLSVFNFTSSSQDSGSSSPERSKNEEGKKRTKRNSSNWEVMARVPMRAPRILSRHQIKKNRLEAINHKWGITEEMDAFEENELSRDEGPRKSSKRVTFLSPVVMSDETLTEVPQGSTDELGTTRESLSGGSSPVLNDQTPPGQEMTDSVDKPDTQIPEKRPDESPLKHSPKRSRLEEEGATLETTPKRPRASPGRRGRSQMSPAVLSPVSTSPKGDKSVKNSRKVKGASPIVSSPAGRRSPRSPSASVGRPPSGIPAVMKRNHKGESPLHLAAIKGDMEAVKEFLEQGADPNLKDNAGWTPLHEACNLGHLPVVEVLVSGGALLNTPGYKNDSPLHDAVRNRHPAIVKLLLQQGASQNVLNQCGKRPADYAASPEMLEIFQEASEGNQCAKTSLSPSALSMVSDSVRRNEMAVFLTSKLSQAEQLQVAKLGELLEGRMANTFSGSVSHVVVPEGHMPTTSSSLMGLLAGCWVVKCSWVEACLQAGEWIPENEHEAGEGPQRSRINRCSLLPPLFDGCFFFLLGSFKAPSKDELTKLLRGGGGQLLIRQPKPDSDVTQTLRAAAYHALPGSDQALCTQYIIFDRQGPHKPPAVRRGKVWSAPSNWIIDCIAAFRLLPVSHPQTSV